MIRPYNVIIFHKLTARACRALGCVGVYIYFLYDKIIYFSNDENNIWIYCINNVFNYLNKYAVGDGKGTGWII